MDVRWLAVVCVGDENKTSASSGVEGGHRHMG